MKNIKKLPTHAVRRRRFFYGPTADSVDLAMVGTLTACREYIAQFDGSYYRTGTNELVRDTLTMVTVKSLRPSAMKDALRLHTR